MRAPWRGFVLDVKAEVFQPRLQDNACNLSLLIVYHLLHCPVDVGLVPNHVYPCVVILSFVHSRYLIDCIIWGLVAPPDCQWIIIETSYPQGVRTFGAASGYAQHNSTSLSHVTHPTSEMTPILDNLWNFGSSVNQRTCLPKSSFLYEILALVISRRHRI